jgi:urease accessory protein
MQSRFIRTSVVSTAAVLLLSSTAFAHHAEWMHDRPLVQGLSMPVHGIDHLLVAFAVGLVAARLGGAAAWAVPAIFGVFLWTGGLLNAYGVAVPWIEPAILGSSLLLGAVLVARRTLSLGAGLVLAAALAVVQGSALITAPGGAVPPFTIAWFSLGCVLSASAVIGRGVATGALLPGAERKAALRYAGAAIAAVAIVAYAVPGVNDAIIRLLE